MLQNPKSNAARRNRALRKLRSSNLPQEISATLQALIDFLDHRSGYCLAWPSVATLAKKLQKSPRTIRFHLQSIKGMRIFQCREKWSPATAMAYVEKKYGYNINLNNVRGTAPVLYEVNEDHPLWDSSKTLPDATAQRILDAVAAMSEKRNRKSKSGLRGVIKDVVDDMPRGVVDDIQLLNAKKVASAPSSTLNDSADPSLVYYQKRALAKPAPDRTCAVNSLSRIDSALDHPSELNHLPTRRLTNRIESGSPRNKKDEESFLSEQVRSGPRPSASTLSDSLNLGTGKGSDLEPEEREYSSFWDCQNLEPEERDLNPQADSGPRPPVSALSDSKNQGAGTGSPEESLTGSDLLRILQEQRELTRQARRRDAPSRIPFNIPRPAKMVSGGSRASKDSTEYLSEAPEGLPLNWDGHGRPEGRFRSEVQKTAKERTEEIINSKPKPAGPVPA